MDLFIIVYRIIFSDFAYDNMFFAIYDFQLIANCVTLRETDCYKSDEYIYIYIYIYIYMYIYIYNRHFQF